MFAPVIHTYGAISSVRNALGVYLWLQNPPDRGGLIFMGSVNRDFVFAGQRAGRPRRTVHTWNLHTRPERGGEGVGGVRAAGCVTVRWTALSSGSRARASERAAGLEAIWEAALSHKWKNSPCLYSLGLSYRLRPAPSSPLPLLRSSRQLLY